MATAKQVLDRAFSKAAVKREGVGLTEDQYSDGIDIMNDLMSQWASIGISLGYTRVKTIGDSVTVENWALKVLKSSLTPLIAGEFQKPLTTVMVTEASSDYKFLLQRKVELQEANLPDTLPIGSGNNPDWFSDRSNFFIDETEDDILTASGQDMQNEKGEQIDSSN